MPESQSFSGVYRTHEFRCTDTPVTRAGTAFHRAHDLIEQYHPWKHRCTRKVSGERRVAGGYGERSLLFHGTLSALAVGFACAASERSEDVIRMFPVWM